MRQEYIKAVMESVAAAFEFAHSKITIEEFIAKDLNFYDETVKEDGKEKADLQLADRIDTIKATKSLIDNGTDFTSCSTEEIGELVGKERKRLKELN